MNRAAHIVSSNYLEIKSVYVLPSSRISVDKNVWTLVVSVFNVYAGYKKDTKRIYLSQSDGTKFQDVRTWEQHTPTHQRSPQSSGAARGKRELKYQIIIYSPCCIIMWGQVQACWKTLQLDGHIIEGLHGLLEHMCASLASEIKNTR